MTDKFYDYSKFGDERLKGILTGWDGLGGNHGLVVKFCAELLEGKTVLDVGCGLCHLYEVFKAGQPKEVPTYVGVDNDKRIVAWAKKRYPELDIHRADVRDLSFLEDKFDTVFAIGLYRQPVDPLGIEQMLSRANKKLVLTYLHRGAEPNFFPDIFWSFLKSEKIRSIEVLAQKIKAIEVVQFHV